MILIIYKKITSGLQNISYRNTMAKKKKLNPKSKAKVQSPKKLKSLQSKHI